MKISLPSLLLILILGQQGYAQARHLHITTGFTPPVSDFFKSVLEEADKRLPNISISFEVLPAERSLKLVESGFNDAECCRIPEVIFKTYKNMLTVPVSFYSVRFSVFSKRQDVTITSFEDLKPFSVGTVKGWKAAVDNIQRVSPAQVYIVTKPEQMFGMLQQGRIDFGVMGYMSGLKTISNLRLKDIKAIEPPLVDKPLYLLLAKKNEDLKPVFAEVLNEMTSDGTIDKLYQEITSKF